MIHTNLFGAVTAFGHESWHDAYAKNLFSFKAVLAHILHLKTAEFKYHTIEQITCCLDGVLVEVSKEKDGIFVNADGLLEKDNSESSDPDAGKIFYDVRFHVTNLQGITIRVDLEIQGELLNNRYLDARSTYYSARMIDEQKGIVFEDDDYGKIQKVYSIWFIKDDAPSHTNREIDHDLNNFIHVTYIYIHDPLEAEKGSLIRLSGSILSDTMAIDKKIMILEEEFNIRSVVVRKGVFAMCTLGKSIALKSEVLGEERGIIIGEALGEKRGITIGEEIANRSAAINLYQMKLPIEKIAFAVNESIETVRKWLTEASNTNKS